MHVQISIIMPVKNAGIFLEDCLESILNQDFTNWELIAINDHSSDNSKELLMSYAQKDTRIKKLDNIGSGIIEALRLAYSNSSGSFITRMDADDLMSANKLSSLLGLLKASGEPSVATGNVQYFSNKTLGDGYKRYESWLNELTNGNSNFLEIYKECVIPSPCWMISRDDLDRIGAFESDLYPEDYDLCFRMYEVGLKVAGSKEVLHQWRDYQERTSRNDDNYADNTFLNMKLHYFLKIDRKAASQLFVWGAGKKGKQIALKLAEQRLDFRWFCDNPNKIGRDIYGVVLEDSAAILEESNFQCITLIANPEEQVAVKEAFHKSKNSNTELIWFC